MSKLDKFSLVKLLEISASGATKLISAVRIDVDAHLGGAYKKILYLSDMNEPQSVSAVNIHRQIRVYTIAQ